MKKLLFFILLFPVVSFAQTELGANIGYNGVYFSNPASAGFPGTGLSGKTARGVMLSMKVVTNLSRNGQFGFGLDIGTLTQRVSAEMYRFNSAFPYKLQTYSINQKIARPYFHPHINGNYVFHLIDVRLYVGPNMGVLIAKGDLYEIAYSNGKAYDFVKSGTYVDAGFTLGMQTGILMDLGSNVSFNLEVAPRTINFNGSFLVPVTAGLRFKL